jgi:hypothetical protein
MAQLSRPYQIALAALCLLAAVWFVALRPHSNGPSESASPAPVSSPAPAGSTPSSAYHGSAPGVAGLSHDIAKARGAVSASQQSAKQLEGSSAQASGGTPSAPTRSKAPAPSHSPAASTPRRAPATTTAHRTVAPRTTGTKTPSASSHSAAAAPSMQLEVEAELKQGRVVTILFWNPKASDDTSVRAQLQRVASKLRGSVSAHYALADQVGAFGSITHGVQVYGTPTVLIVNKRGHAQTLSGLTDAYAIEQAISEIRHV